MKSSIFFALFLLCAFTASFLPSATAVVDTDGDPLKNPGTYFIVSGFRPGGGVEFSATGNETCPLTVVQNFFRRGFPVILSSRLRIPFIGEGQPFSIRFSIVPFCATTPSMWTIVEGLPESPAVKLTGYENTVSADEESICGHIGMNGTSLVVSEDNVLLVQFQKFRSAPDAAPLALKNHLVLSGSE